VPRNQSRTEAAVRRSLDSSIEASATPGLQYLAVDARDTLFELTGGWADIARRIPIEPRTTLMRTLGIAPDEVGYAIAAPVPHANGYLEKYSLMNLLKGFLISGELIGDYEGKWLRIEPHYLNGPAFGGLVGTARDSGSFFRTNVVDRELGARVQR
jgi:hypothetical protein